MTVKRSISREALLSKDFSQLKKSRTGDFSKEPDLNMLVELLRQLLA